MSAVISSRTPEGEPARCPICGAMESIEPTRPPGDAPCPACGHLLWIREGTGGRVAPRTLSAHAERLLRSVPRRPMFGIGATLARQVGRAIRAARARVPAHAPAEASGVYWPTKLRLRVDNRPKLPKR